MHTLLYTCSAGYTLQGRVHHPLLAELAKNRTVFYYILFIFQLNASETTEQAISFSHRKQTESRQCHLDIGRIIVPAARLIKNARSQEVNQG